MASNKSLAKTFLSKPEYYIFKAVGIISIALIAIAFVAFAAVHTWRFIEALFTK
jgi:uncharacterized membrane protein YukC